MCLQKIGCPARSVTGPKIKPPLWGCFWGEDVERKKLLEWSSLTRPDSGSPTPTWVPKWRLRAKLRGSVFGPLPRRTGLILTIFLVRHERLNKHLGRYSNLHLTRLCNYLFSNRITWGVAPILSFPHGRHLRKCAFLKPTSNSAIRVANFRNNKLKIIYRTACFHQQFVSCYSYCPCTALSYYTCCPITTAVLVQPCPITLAVLLQQLSSYSHVLLHLLSLYSLVLLQQLSSYSHVLLHLLSYYNSCPRTVMSYYTCCPITLAVLVQLR